MQAGNVFGGGEVAVGAQPKGALERSPQMTWLTRHGARRFPFRSNSDFAAYSALKCIWFVFIVINVNQVLSVSVTVRPSGCL